MPSSDRAGQGRAAPQPASFARDATDASAVTELRIRLDDPQVEGEATHVSGLLQVPARATACFVMAHGAGAGMRHRFMAAIAADLMQSGVATLRYQFPYMEKGLRRPDSPRVCDATVRSAVATARSHLPNLCLIAGGKSFGARMTSQAQARQPLQGVRGLVFLGFPLHPPDKPDDSRGEHLESVRIPMLFLQGTRDEFARKDLLAALIERLGRMATLAGFDGADHSFHVPARSGRSDATIRAELAAAIAAWSAGLDAPQPHAG